ncbi:hypothetical protein [Vreelandella salicampi]|uniref:Uncharacterized protein n=1 Tax=Vreelandella salicampi TaxID=1449798 RepID=A0A7Z0LKT3_9GAMM|nr:hypothetical protein [Halomonas salicampi]NYS60824.1 hypothetical protein [Halomonas salicampi]
MTKTKTKTKTKITTTALAHAAETGASLGHLSPPQAWAAHRLSMPPSALSDPLPGHLVTILDNIDRAERRRFADACPDPDTMIQAAYDEQHPAYLRLAIQEKLAEGMRSCFPDLKPKGVDSQGNRVYLVDDLAKALGTTEDELAMLAAQRGMQNTINDSDVTPIH